MKYHDQLKSPQWKAYRVKLIEARGCKCQECDVPSTEEGLQVHHVTYLRGLPLWEYPDELVIVLCDTCHGDRQVHDEEARLEFSRMCGRMGSWDVYELSKGLRKLNGNEYNPRAWDAFQSLKDAANFSKTEGSPKS